MQNYNAHSLKCNRLYLLKMATFKINKKQKGLVSEEYGFLFLNNNTSPQHKGDIETSADGVVKYDGNTTKTAEPTLTDEISSAWSSNHTFGLSAGNGGRRM